ncbi:MAG: branched-chain amino acid ABC transporter permease [Thermodesulfobacteriota bacterium]|nr:branched-chain amino acid ABC transporter permease [Thermodesulfobacteriota bacterium]
MVLQLIVNGVVSGAIYALMAVGFALIYNSTHIFHLAHGAVFTLSGYTLYFVVKGMNLPLPVAILFAITLSILLGIAIEVRGYRPLRERKVSLAAFLISSLGIFIVVENGLILLFGAIPKLITEEPLKAYQIGSLVITQLHMTVILCCLIIFPLLHLLFAKTRVGKMIRALSDHPELALIIGLETRRLYLFITILGAALAGVAGIFVGLDVGVTPIMGWDAVLIAAVAVIIGSVGYLPGAGVAALLVGLVQNLSVLKISAQWQGTITFGLLILFLVFRPKGIFGKMIASRGA